MPLIAAVKPVEGAPESRLVNIRQWVADSFPQATEIEQVQVGYITFGFFLHTHFFVRLLRLLCTCCRSLGSRATPSNKLNESLFL
jgi:hypothetical protein